MFYWSTLWFASAIKIMTEEAHETSPSVTLVRLLNSPLRLSCNHL